jgi:transporter family protein
MSVQAGWKLFALGSAFFAGLTAILGKLGVEGLNSNLATWIRTVVILVFTAGIISYRNEWQWPRPGGLSPVLFLVLSGIATGLSWLCYYRALQMAPASMVAPLDKLSVAVAIALGVVFLGEKLTPQLLVGGGLIVTGAVVLVWPWK